jgi:hypothetical protein
MQQQQMQMQLQQESAQQVRWQRQTLQNGSAVQVMRKVLTHGVRLIFKLIVAQPQALAPQTLLQMGQIGRYLHWGATFQRGHPIRY